MKLKGYLDYVEIRTKVASVIPFLLGTFFAKYRYGNINVINFLLMLGSLICFDMATTAINNYVDFRKTEEAHKQTGNIKFIQEGISEKIGAIIIFILLSIAVVLGMVLTYRTNLIVLLIGVLAFGVGIFYTFGPIPISRMPLGEVFSGFFMGFVILFLSIFIHAVKNDIAGLWINNWNLVLNINIKECLYLFMLSLPGVMSIANIMLANNICDIEEDIKIKRYTLPYYIGKINALMLFRLLYYIGYLDIIVIIMLKIAPVILAVSLLTFFPINKNINIFNKKQQKSSTFVLSVKNFVMMTGSLTVLTALAILLRV